MALATHTGILSTVQSTSPSGLASARTLRSSTTYGCDFQSPSLSLPNLLLRKFGIRISEFGIGLRCAPMLDASAFGFTVFSASLRRDAFQHLPLRLPLFTLIPNSAFRIPHSVISDFRNHSRKSAASVTCFSPGHFRRTTTRPVSYYALFKCMAASKPTSWLSVQLHILLHLTCTWGP